MFNLITKFNEYRENRKIQNQIERIKDYIRNGYSLVNTTKYTEYETNHYYYREFAVDRLNYQIVDSENNFVEFVPGHIVDLLPTTEYRRVTDTCELGEFFRVERIYAEYDNLTTSEAELIVYRFERSTGIDRVMLHKRYPNLLAYADTEFNPTLAYDKDCKPTAKQAKNIFANSLVMHNNLSQSGQPKYYINN